MHILWVTFFCLDIQKPDANVEVKNGAVCPHRLCGRMELYFTSVQILGVERWKGEGKVMLTSLKLTVLPAPKEATTEEQSFVRC